MADFTVRPTSGTTVQILADPATVDAPTRLNPIAGTYHRYHRMIVGSAVTVKAAVGGVENLLDGALGGRLFTWSFAEWPNAGLVAITSPAGQTSVATFTPIKQGHHLIVCGRASGGAVMLPIIAIVL